MTEQKVELSTVLVRRQFKNRDEVKTDEVTEPLEVHVFKTEPARVGLEYRHTVNLGNYESAHVAVLVQVPCYAEEKDAAFDHAKAWAEARIEAELNELRAGKKNPF